MHRKIIKIIFETLKTIDWDKFFEIRSKKRNEYNRSITMIILRSSAISASSQRFPSFQRHVGRRLALLGRGLTQLSPARISECRTKRSGRCRFFDVSLAPSRFNLSPFLLFHFPFVERNFRFATYRNGSVLSKFEQTISLFSSLQFIFTF